MIERLGKNDQRHLMRRYYVGDRPIPYGEVKNWVPAFAQSTCSNDETRRNLISAAVVANGGVIHQIRESDQRKAKEGEKERENKKKGKEKGKGKVKGLGCPATGELMRA